MADQIRSPTEDEAGCDAVSRQGLKNQLKPWKKPKMTSAARKKVDPRTLELFDREVDKPEHDHILVRLFEDDEQLGRLIHEVHGSPQLLPFDKRSSFNVFDSHGTLLRKVGIDESTSLTGHRPVWKSASPFQIGHKSLEVLMNFSTDEHGKYSRIIGFIDVGISYVEKLCPHIALNGKGVAHWKPEFKQRMALFEVKSTWPTVGNLIRQLNLYRYASPVGFDGRRKNILVGPDDSMNDIANQHGYRLITFNKDASKFTVCPAPPSKVKAETVAGEF